MPLDSISRNERRFCFGGRRYASSIRKVGELPGGTHHTNHSDLADWIVTHCSCLFAILSLTWRQAVLNSPSLLNHRPAALPGVLIYLIPLQTHRIQLLSTHITMEKQRESRIASFY